MKDEHTHRLPVLFSTTEYAHLSAGLLQYDAYEDGAVERDVFADGERYQRVVTTVVGRNVFLIGGTHNNDATLELYDLAYGLVAQGAHSLTIIIPYFGYSTMERVVEPGEIAPAKARAEIFSSLPQPPSGISVFLLDVHSEGIPYYFDRHVRSAHLSASKALIPHMKELGGDDFVIGCTDTGRAKWVHRLGKELGVLPSFVIQLREGSEKKALAVDLQAKGKNVVIYDDLVRSGGSLMRAASAYRDAGAKEVSAVCTHGVLPGEALSKLHHSKLITKFVLTNSHPQAAALKSNDFLTVVSIVPLLHEEIQKMSFGRPA